MEHNPHPEEPQAMSDELIRALLLRGYAALLHERYPINSHIENCSSEGSAHFWAMEKENLEIPKDITFDAIKDSLPEKDQERIQKIWGVVMALRNSLIQTSTTLKHRWATAPETQSIIDESEFDDTTIKIRTEYRNAVNLTTNKPDNAIHDEANILAPLDRDPEISSSEAIKGWQLNEKALRGSFDYTHKAYMDALHLYHEALIEKSPDKKSFVLPEDHPKRQEIAIRNRYLRIIQLFHTSAGIAKTEHHTQKRGKLRKFSKTPYLNHTLDVTLTLILDVIPFIIEEKKIKMANPYLVIPTGPLHDTFEDTLIGISQTVQKLENQCNQLDAMVVAVAKSGFERDQDTFISDNMDILHKDNARHMKQLLRILSNNTVLTPNEEKEGKINTRNLKALEDKNISGSSDKKRVDFIKRLFAITESPKTRQAAIMIKTADTINNISIAENKGKTPKQKIETLRAVVSRFVTFLTQDYDNTNYPLFNLLPNLIETAIEAYIDIHVHNYKHLAEIDFELIENLNSLKRHFPKIPLPKKDQKILDEYKEKKLSRK